MHSCDWGGNGRVDAIAMVRIAAGFNERADGIRRFGLAQQYPVYAAPEDLAELPGVDANICGVGAVDRRLDDDGRRAVARACRAGIDETAHVFGEARHVERPMLHPDIDVVRPGVRVFTSLGIGQRVSAVPADVVNRLVLRQQLDGSVDRARHDHLLCQRAR
jgi:hypothetical protein